MTFVFVTLLTIRIASVALLASPVPSTVMYLQYDRRGHTQAKEIIDHI